MSEGVIVRVRREQGGTALTAAVTPGDLSLSVDWAIDFNDEPCRMAVEICHEPVNHLLPPKMQPLKSARSKLLPQQPLLRRRAFPQLPSHVRLIARNPLLIDDAPGKQPRLVDHVLLPSPRRGGVGGALLALT